MSYVDKMFQAAIGTMPKRQKSEQWRIVTTGDGWCGTKEVRDGADLVVAGSAARGEQILLEHDLLYKLALTIKEYADEHDGKFPFDSVLCATVLEVVL